LEHHYTVGNAADHMALDYQPAAAEFLGRLCAGKVFPGLLVRTPSRQVGDLMDRALLVNFRFYRAHVRRALCHGKAAGCLI
jgi:hypothetical protein